MAGAMYVVDTVLYGTYTMASLFVSLLLMLLNLLRLDRKWQFRKTLSHAFHDTDYPTTIYGHSGKHRCMLTVTLTIQ